MLCPTLSLPLYAVPYPECTDQPHVPLSVFFAILDKHLDKL